jgi:hypothetical protein
VYRLKYPIIPATTIPLKYKTVCENSKCSLNEMAIATIKLFIKISVKACQAFSLSANVLKLISIRKEHKIRAKNDANNQL